MRPNKRDELVRKALAVYYRGGFHATGMDQLAAETGISKTSIYKHFRTKQALILAVLRLRDENFRTSFRRRIEDLATSPASRLLAIFDVLDEWIAEDGFRGCMFIRAGAEFQDEADPIRVQAGEHKRILLGYFSRLCRDAGARDPDQLARQLLVLKEGAIVTAVLGHDTDPAGAARSAAEILIAGALA